MRLLRIGHETPPGDLPVSAIVCHDVRHPGKRNEILVRKGTWLEAEEARKLLARGVGELHLAAPDEDDLTEDEAAAALGAALLGRRVQTGEARFGQVDLNSGGRGMLRLNPAAVDRINAQEGVLLVCAEPNRPVDTGTTVAVVKCAPVLMPRKTVRAVEQIARELGPVVEVIPFQTMRVAFTAPADRLRGGAFEHAHSALAHALEWYGSRLDVIVASEATPEAMADTYRQACDHGVELILAAGAAATDPLDLVFDALHMAGGEVLQIGIPAEPGTACWIGRLGSTGVLGLASCELFGRPGALDLILPRLLSGERLDRDLVRGLGVGGLLLGPSRLAPYHAGHRAND